MSDLRAQLALMQQRIDGLEADMRAERDRLLGIVETQAEHVRRLTDQRPAAQPDVCRGWWRRLRGG